jgi:septal ring factor EnvC (AmiA/AmiB activator)
MGRLDRYYNQVDYRDTRMGEYNEGERNDGVLSFRSGSPVAPAKVCGAALNLVYQAAEVIKDIESQASDAEKTSYQKLRIAQKRIEELETELESARLCINQARAKLQESDELAKAEKSRLDEAERRMCELEMRARTAETQARENANLVARIEEAIRTQILSRRQPPNKMTQTR